MLLRTIIAQTRIKTALFHKSIQGGEKKSYSQINSAQSLYVNYAKELIAGNTPGTMCSHILSSSSAILLIPEDNSLKN